MKKIIMTCGLPGSGKSTWAIKEAEKSNVKRINKDDLRAMINNSKFTKGNEKDVLKIRNILIEHWLEKDQTVIIDDTNLHPKHETYLKQLAKEWDCEFEKVFFNVPVEECVRRDLKRENSVGQDVIYRMYEQYLLSEVTRKPSDLPSCIICDIDGTLAKKSDRSPYEWTRVGEDTVQIHTKMLLEAFAGIKTIILVSGRDGRCVDITKYWLMENKISYDELYMRPVMNSEKDTIIKYNIFKNYIEPNYKVDFVIDDRPSVIRMWKSIGLPVFDANQNYYKYEF